jgi:hypothetical protein
MSTAHQSANAGTARFATAFSVVAYSSESANTAPTSARNAARWLARFCSEMSLAIFDAPMTAPLESWIGETVSDTGISVPSLRRLTVSKC